MLLPTIRWTKKRYKCVDYELQKAQHGHKDVFPVTSKFHAKERSSDRSPVWRSLEIFCVKLRVIEKKRLIVCVVCFRMLWELVHIEHSFWKGEHTFLSDWLWTACIWHGFPSPFSLFSYFCYQTEYKKESSIEVWTMDVQLLRTNFGDLAESIKRSASDWLGDLVP